MPKQKLKIKVPRFYAGTYYRDENDYTFDAETLSKVVTGKSYSALTLKEKQNLEKYVKERGINDEPLYGSNFNLYDTVDDPYVLSNILGISDNNHNVKKSVSIYRQDVVDALDRLDRNKIFNPDAKEDKSERVLLKGANSSKAKYFDNRYITKDALKEIKRVSKKYNLDEYKLLSALMIDAPRPATTPDKAITASDYFNTHNITSAYIPPKFEVDSNKENDDKFEFLLKQLGVYNEKGKYSEKVVNDRIKSRVKELHGIIDAIEPSQSLLENHARFIYQKGFESVNPKQKGYIYHNRDGSTSTVKHSYTDQVFDGANSVKLAYPNLFDLDNTSDKNLKYGGMSRRKKYNFGGIRSTHDATADYLGMARNSGNSFFGNDMIDLFYHGGKNDDTGIPFKNYVDKLIANDKLIYANMQNKINNEIVTARGVARCGGLVRRKRKDFGGVMSGNAYRSIIAGKNNRDYFENEGVGIKRKYLDDVYEYGNLDLNAQGIAKANQLMARDSAIYANMQNKINNEVLTSRGITAKFGGLVGTPRRKFYWGGTSINDPGSVQWGTRVQASDIDESKYSADGEGIVGGNVLSGAGTGLGIGAAVGGTAALATGAAAGSWLGPIGAGIGALIGGIVGLFTGRKKKRQEERRRQELLAEQAEMERQQTLGNMQDKVENDVATIRQSNLDNYSEGTGFYAKLGGMIGRRKLNTGGQVVPNSSNSVVAYGQTHEQYNPATGETGIIYGDSEIEGGGAKNGRMYAGEVIRETPEGGQVFSDTIKVPGTNRTFADYAKKLTDMKGKKEAQVIQLADGVTLSLSALDKSKTNKLQTGTNVRNIEKLVYRMNKARGESEAIDAKTEDLFEVQELYATALGLRNDAPVMRCGGMVRKKRPFGGYTSPYSLTGVSAPKLTTLPPIQTTASAGGGSAFKFGFNEFGLGMNLASSLFGIVGNALNTRANRKAIEFESTLHVPKGNKVDAVQYSTDYDISEELQELGTQERRAARYITDNTSNVQTARNSVANLAINAQLARNKLYGAKKDYQRQRYDLNRQERVNARNANSQIMYQDAINEYNKAVGLNQQLMAVRTQGLQGMLQGIEGLAGAVNNYASARLYEKLWPRGVTNHMRSGFACGGLARRKRA